jgi:hypothetical protein
VVGVIVIGISQFYSRPKIAASLANKSLEITPVFSYRYGVGTTDGGAVNLLCPAEVSGEEEQECDGDSTHGVESCVHVYFFQKM